MAARQSYVYAVMVDGAIAYVGKGTGNRLNVSARKHGGQPVVLRECKSEDDAFAYEREMIALHRPSRNLCKGGNGGRAKAKPSPRKPKWLAEIERIGSKVYAARFLLTRLDDANCEQWGVSKLDMNRLREVANGSRA